MSVIQQQPLGGLVAAREMAQRNYFIRIRSQDRISGRPDSYTIDLQTYLTQMNHATSLATVGLHDFQFEGGTETTLDGLALGIRPRAIYIHANMSFPNNIQTFGVNNRNISSLSNILAKVPVRESSGYFVDGSPPKQLVYNPMTTIEINLRDHLGRNLGNLAGVSFDDLEHEMSLEIQFLE